MRKRSVLLGVAVATMLMTAGCQSKYEKIEVPGAIQNVEDETPIYIYSTINLYCGSMDITALIKEHQEDQYAEEEITEEVSEQEIQEEAEGGVEDERETVEENIYQNVPE